MSRTASACVEGDHRVRSPSTWNGRGGLLRTDLDLRHQTLGVSCHGDRFTRTQVREGGRLAVLDDRDVRCERTPLDATPRLAGPSANPYFWRRGDGFQMTNGRQADPQHLHLGTGSNACAAHGPRSDSSLPDTRPQFS